MYELGNVIPRIIHTMATAPNTGIPFLFSKLDLKDGYWRMNVSPDDAFHFAYVLPRLNDTDPIQLVIPDSLQMGWSEQKTLTYVRMYDFFLDISCFLRVADLSFRDISVLQKDPTRIAFHKRNHKHRTKIFLY